MEVVHPPIRTRTTDRNRNNPGILDYIVEGFVLAVTQLEKKNKFDIGPFPTPTRINM